MANEGEEMPQVKEAETEAKKEYTNVILVTHNARMRCFLEDHFKSQMDTFKSQMDTFRKSRQIKKEIRFNNSSILLLTIEKGNNNIKLELVYDGGDILKPKGNAYFVKDEKNASEKNASEKNKKMKYIKFGILETNKEDGLHKKIINVHTIDKNYKIYIIRHGEAEHNNPSGSDFKNTIIKGISKLKGKVKKNLHRFLDSSLTKSGISQSVLLAEYFNSIEPFTIHYLFASYLKRTRETLDNMIVKLNNSKVTLNAPTVIILPCSHELHYNKDGNCDYNSRWMPVGEENKNNCLDLKKCKDENEMKYCCTLDISKKKIDWNFYINFKDYNTQCRTTNMIIQLVSYIDSNPPQDLFRGGVNFFKKYLKYKYKYLQIKNSQIS